MSDTKKYDTDADYRKKSHAHKDKTKEHNWRICPLCRGSCIDQEVLDDLGFISPCIECDGEGIIL